MIESLQMHEGSSFCTFPVTKLVDDSRAYSSRFINRVKGLGSSKADRFPNKRLEFL